MKKLLVFVCIFLFSFLNINPGPKEGMPKKDSPEESDFPETAIADLSNPFDESIIKQIKLTTPYPIKALACSPDGKFFITNQQLFLCKPTHEKRAVSDLNAEQPYDKISLSASGFIAATLADKKTISIENPFQEEKILTKLVTTEKITDLAWHPTDNILATASEDGMISLWRPFLEKNEQIIASKQVSTETTKIIGKFSFKKKPNLHLSWSPDGKKLTVTSGNKVFFLELQNKPNTKKKDLFCEHAYFHLSKIIAFFWRTNDLFTSISKDQKSISYDFKNKTETTTKSVIKHLACSSDGKYTASVDESDFLQIHTKGKLVYKDKEYLIISHIAWLPQTHTLLVVTKTNSFNEPGDTILFIDMPDENS